MPRSRAAPPSTRPDDRKYASRYPVVPSIGFVEAAAIAAFPSDPLRSSALLTPVASATLASACSPPPPSASSADSLGVTLERRRSACSAAANSSAALLWLPRRPAARAKNANLCAISTRRIGRHPRDNARFNDGYTGILPWCSSSIHDSATAITLLLQPATQGSGASLAPIELALMSCSEERQFAGSSRPSLQLSPCSAQPAVKCRLLGDPSNAAPPRGCRRECRAPIAWRAARRYSPGARDRTARPARCALR